MITPVRTRPRRCAPRSAARPAGAGQTGHEIFPAEPLSSTLRPDSLRMPTEATVRSRMVSLVACLVGSLLLRAAAGGVGILVGFLMARIHTESLAAGGLGVAA